MCGHPLSRSQGLNTQGDPWRQGVHTRGECCFIQHEEEVGCSITPWQGESGRRSPSDKASQCHHIEHHCQDSWHHHGRQTNNGALRCHWVGYLPGPHPCSHLQRTSYVQDVSRLCSKTPWTWYEMDSAQLVNGTRHRLMGQTTHHFEWTLYYWATSCFQSQTGCTSVNTYTIGLFCIIFLKDITRNYICCISYHKTKYNTKIYY